MGVSLERVQFKFASIIGELCSEPDVLSQFAVWVDLRIAEYKTKGSISLDCSGSVPNPIWMKGVKGGPARSGSSTGDTGQPRARQRGSVPNSPSIHRTPVASPQMSSNQLFNERLQATDSHWDTHNSTQQQNVQSRLSPDIVVIKDEMGLTQPSSCAFSSGWDSSGRKRTSVDSGEMQGDYFQSSAKSRRVSGPGTPSAAQESSSNQSLMSIINTESPSGGDQGEGDNDIFKVTMEMQEELRKGQGLPASPSSTAFSPRRPTATATSSASSPSDSNLPQVQSIQGQTVWPNTAGGNSQAGQWEAALESTNHFAGGLNLSRQFPSPSQPGVGESGALSTSTSDAAFVQNKSTFAGRNVSAAVRSFDRWFVKNSRNDRRKIEDIPAVELDVYLEKFFQTVTKLDGANYDILSFRVLRSNIERHLKEHGYPHSIVKSSAFVKSRHSYKWRSCQLQQNNSDKSD